MDLPSRPLQSMVGTFQNPFNLCWTFVQGYRERLQGPSLADIACLVLPDADLT